MNRIVIIGNGFDLAHGLKSRYEDFMLYLINSAIEDLNKNDEKSTLYESLFVLKKNKSNPISFTPFDSLESIMKDSYIFKTPYFVFLHTNYRVKENWSIQHKLSITFNSKLFYDLFSKENWTDIEKGYFDLLLEIFRNSGSQIVNTTEFNDLNSNFEKLKELFIQYISKINPNANLINHGLKYHFDKCFDDDDLYRSSFKPARALQILRRFEKEELERIIFVNFNYTNLLNHYVRTHDNNNYMIPIHGFVHNKNSIVFGYGDEMTEYYKQLEDLDSIEVLKHFKSHYYHYNDAYSKLLYEIENFEYDVVVFGHSLGLSDRVLLNTIFENDNCKAIHLYHSGSDNHFKKRIALSRHFDDKKAFRKKLIEESDYLKIERH